MSVTKRLVDYVTDTEFEDFPSEVMEKVKLLILDAVGCGLGGTQTKLGKIFIDIAKTLGGKPESTIIGSDLMTDCTRAASTNAELINALDYSDSGPAGHLGTTIIPAAMAIAERINASGKDFLTAVALGYEVGGRVAVAIKPTFNRFLQVHGIGTLQAFGSVAAVGKLIGLKPNVLLSAFGIAGSYTPVRHAGKFGLYEDYSYKRAKQPHAITWIKDNVGRPSEAGILAALLAEKGFLATTSILDGKNGFWAMACSDRCDFDQMIKGLGEEYMTMRVGYKPYPACRQTHTTLDALTEVLQREKLKPEDIEKINVNTVRVLADSFVDYNPLNMIDAQFSVPYPAAMVVYNVPRPQWYLDENLKNQTYLEMASRVKVEFDSKLDPNIGSGPSNVLIFVKDGSCFETIVENPRGSPENPWTVEEIEEKFLELARAIIKPERSSRIIQDINKLESIDNTFNFTKLLRI